MKIRSILSISFVLLISASIFISAKFSDPGIRVKEIKVNSTVYEIKLVSIPNEKTALILDSRFMAKTGIISAHTLATTRVCTVEVRNEITPGHLKVVVESAGLVIAKSFE